MCMGRSYSSFRGKTCKRILGEKLGVPVLSEDEICKYASVDALCILTPPEFHYIYAMKVLKRENTFL